MQNKHEIISLTQLDFNTIFLQWNLAMLNRNLNENLVFFPVPAIFWSVNNIH